MKYYLCIILDDRLGFERGVFLYMNLEYISIIKNLRIGTKKCDVAESNVR